MDTQPHLNLLSSLFAYQSKVELIFNDVLGLHDIEHIAIARLDTSGQWIIFSSTPSLEFNLFSSELWLFDKSYSYAWLRKEELASWISLYKKERHAELYYHKQLKNNFSQGLSLSIAKKPNHYLYSFAGSRIEDAVDIKRDLLKMGDYCLNLLQPLFLQAETRP